MSDSTPDNVRQSLDGLLDFVAANLPAAVGDCPVAGCAVSVVSRQDLVGHLRDHDGIELRDTIADLAADRALLASRPRPQERP